MCFLQDTWIRSFFYVAQPFNLSIHIIYMCHLDVSLPKYLLLPIHFECNTNFKMLDEFASVLVFDQIWTPTFTLQIVSLSKHYRFNLMAFVHTLISKPTMKLKWKYVLFLSNYLSTIFYWSVGKNKQFLHRGQRLPQGALHGSEIHNHKVLTAFRHR